MKNYRRKYIGFVGLALLLIISGYFLFTGFSFSSAVRYVATQAKVAQIGEAITHSVFKVTHIKTPEQVKAIYMTSCVAGTSYLRDNLVKLIDDTELNSVIIDIKDYSGHLSFMPEDENLRHLISPTCRALDMKEFIGILHNKNIYVIGRITVFQDPLLTKERPDLAVKKLSDTTAVWKDFKGLSFTDPGAKDVWDRHVTIAKESYAIGFDELNFDYIRFPSDGPMNDIYFSWSDGRPKTQVLGEFFAYLHNELKPLGIVMSADLFGMTTTNSDDLNIGQKLEVALPHFDFVAPMVYPSHYPKNFLGFENPAERPYEVIKHSMSKGVEKVVVFDATVASTSVLKLRPWLQDFNLGATYTADMVRAQIQATYDSGLNSWMLWNASNRYTKDALIPVGADGVTISTPQEL